MPSVCESCGARIHPDAEQCDLCGARVHPKHSVEEGKEASPPDLSARCSDCGAENLRAARFCNQCGKPLQIEATVAPTKAPPVESDDSDRPAVIRNSIYMASAAVAAVVLLFGITMFSQQRGTAPPDMTPPSDLPLSPLSMALPAETQRQADELKRRIENTPDEITELDLRQELVSLYREAGRPDLAAQAQVPVAEKLESAYAWAYLGDLYYDYMLSRDAAHAQQFANRAIEAYTRSLDLDPDNLDVRTHLAVAYLYDPANPMRSVEEINTVLERDPDHVQANYNRGMMFAQIGRYDQAIEQFEKVLTLTEEGTIAHDRARDALMSIRHVQGQQQ